LEGANVKFKTTILALDFIERQRVKFTTAHSRANAKRVFTKIKHTPKSTIPFPTFMQQVEEVDDMSLELPDDLLHVIINELSLPERFCYSFQLCRLQQSV